MAVVGPLVVHIKLSCWVKPYLYACMLFAWLTGMEPDGEKIAATVARGMKVKFESH